ncbi:MAG: acyl-CoA reductase, partial [Sphingobacteriales bacterium]
QQASQKNGWFTPEFIDLACEKIATNFLDKNLLEQWAAHYHVDENITPKNVGIVMAGNIPLVGFHDFLAVFICGHQQTIKLSTKDDILLKHLVRKLYEWEITVQNYISFAETLKGCDAYIATGSNNSARYFEQYFSKYPNIIRRNRTSSAVLTGSETAEQLSNLSDDIHQYFGLGCRNVSKLFVPKDYNFEPLIRSFDKYGYFGDHHKYKNNFDYQLSLILLNNIYYMTNSATLLTENQALFSPISHLYFEYYEDLQKLKDKLADNNDLQCLVDGDSVAFGEAQNPGLFAYADGVDTMQFLLGV